ncbi:hypothetical protein DIPPA_15593 [Diplonema papillatum]|nr:hypothetical protein DIPPA_15593 [Diplonema papillatum]
MSGLWSFGSDGAEGQRKKALVNDALSAVGAVGRELRHAGSGGEGGEPGPADGTDAAALVEKLKRIFDESASDDGGSGRAETPEPSPYPKSDASAPASARTDADAEDSLHRLRALLRGDTSLSPSAAGEPSGDLVDRLSGPDDGAAHLAAVMADLSEKAAKAPGPALGEAALAGGRPGGLGGMSRPVAAAAGIAEEPALCDPRVFPGIFEVQLAGAAKPRPAPVLPACYSLDSLPRRRGGSTPAMRPDHDPSPAAVEAPRLQPGPALRGAALGQSSDFAGGCGLRAGGSHPNAEPEQSFASAGKSSRNRVSECARSSSSVANLRLSHPAEPEQSFASAGKSSRSRVSERTRSSSSAANLQLSHARHPAEPEQSFASAGKSSRSRLSECTRPSSSVANLRLSHPAEPEQSFASAGKSSRSRLSECTRPSSSVANLRLSHPAEPEQSFASAGIPSRNRVSERARPSSSAASQASSLNSSSSASNRRPAQADAEGTAASAAGSSRGFGLAGGASAGLPGDGRQRHGKRDVDAAAGGARLKRGSSSVGRSSYESPALHGSVAVAGVSLSQLYCGNRTPNPEQVNTASKPGGGGCGLSENQIGRPRRTASEPGDSLRPQKGRLAPWGHAAGGGDAAVEADPAAFAGDLLSICAASRQPRRGGCSERDEGKAELCPDPARKPNFECVGASDERPVTQFPSPAGPLFPASGGTDEAARGVGGNQPVEGGPACSVLGNEAAREESPGAGCKERGPAADAGVGGLRALVSGASRGEGLPQHVGLLHDRQAQSTTQSTPATHHEAVGLLHDRQAQSTTQSTPATHVGLLHDRQAQSTTQSTPATHHEAVGLLHDRQSTTQSTPATHHEAVGLLHDRQAQSTTQSTPATHHEAVGLLHDRQAQSTTQSTPATHPEAAGLLHDRQSTTQSTPATHVGLLHDRQAQSTTQSTPATHHEAVGFLHDRQSTTQSTPAAHHEAVGPRLSPEVLLSVSPTTLAPSISPLTCERRPATRRAHLSCAPVPPPDADASPACSGGARNAPATPPPADCSLSPRSSVSGGTVLSGATLGIGRPSPVARGLLYGSDALPASCGFNPEPSVCSPRGRSVSGCRDPVEERRGPSAPPPPAASGRAREAARAPPPGGGVLGDEQPGSGASAVCDAFPLAARTLAPPQSACGGGRGGLPDAGPEAPSPPVSAATAAPAEASPAASSLLGQQAASDSCGVEARSRDRSAACWVDKEVFDPVLHQSMPSNLVTSTDDGCVDAPYLEERGISTAFVTEKKEFDESTKALRHLSCGPDRLLKSVDSCVDTPNLEQQSNGTALVTEKKAFGESTKARGHLSCGPDRLLTSIDGSCVDAPNPEQQSHGTAFVTEKTAFGKSEKARRHLSCGPDRMHGSPAEAPPPRVRRRDSRQRGAAAYAAFVAKKKAFAAWKSTLPPAPGRAAAFHRLLARRHGAPALQIKTPAAPAHIDPCATVLEAAPGLSRDVRVGIKSIQGGVGRALRSSEGAQQTGFAEAEDNFGDETCWEAAGSCAQRAASVAVCALGARSRRRQIEQALALSGQDAAVNWLTEDREEGGAGASHTSERTRAESAKECALGTRFRRRQIEQALALSGQDTTEWMTEDPEDDSASYSLTTGSHTSERTRAESVTECALGTRSRRRQIERALALSGQDAVDWLTARNREEDEASFSPTTASRTSERTWAESGKVRALSTRSRRRHIEQALALSDPRQDAVDWLTARNQDDDGASNSPTTGSRASERTWADGDWCSSGSPLHRPYTRQGHPSEDAVPASGRCTESGQEEDDATPRPEPTKACAAGDAGRKSWLGSRLRWRYERQDALCAPGDPGGERPLSRAKERRGEAQEAAPQTACRGRTESDPKAEAARRQSSRAKEDPRDDPPRPASAARCNEAMPNARRPCAFDDTESTGETDTSRSCAPSLCMQHGTPRECEETTSTCERSATHEESRSASTAPAARSNTASTGTTAEDPRLLRRQQRLDAREDLRRRYARKTEEAEELARRAEEAAELEEKDAQRRRQRALRLARDEAERAEALRQRRRAAAAAAASAAARHSRLRTLRFHAWQPWRRHVAACRAAAGSATGHWQVAVKRRCFGLWSQGVAQWKQVRFLCFVVRCVAALRCLQKAALRAYVRRWKGVVRARRADELEAGRVHRLRALQKSWRAWGAKLERVVVHRAIEQAKQADDLAATFRRRRARHSLLVWKRKADMASEASQRLRFRQRMMNALSGLTPVPNP